MLELLRGFTLAQKLQAGAISMDDALPILTAIASSQRPKLVVVVDPDIDVRNPDQVEWAIAFRSQPARDVIIIGDLPGGTLAPRSPADVTLLDLDRPRKVDPARFQSKGRNTPFGGWTLKGAAVMTIVAGQIVWQERR